MLRGFFVARLEDAANQIPNGSMQLGLDRKSFAPVQLPVNARGTGEGAISLGVDPNSWGVGQGMRFRARPGPTHLRQTPPAGPHARQSAMLGGGEEGSSLGILF